jgi:hypothetical protein
VKLRVRAMLLSVCLLLPAIHRAAAEPAAAPAAPAPAASAPAPAAALKPWNVDRGLATILVRSTVIALDQANRTGNYAVLHALASPSFQTANTPAKLADVFANFRREKFDLSAGAILEPQLAFDPRVEANGLLHIAGSFAGQPSPFQFDLMYQLVDGRWLLEAISAGTPGSQDKPKDAQQSGPAATAAAPVTQPTPKQAAKQAAKPGAPQSLLARPDKSNPPSTFSRQQPTQKTDELRRN